MSAGHEWQTWEGGRAPALRSRCSAAKSSLLDSGRAIDPRSLCSAASLLTCKHGKAARSAPTRPAFAAAPEERPA
ncbi:MAG TPA: hypothetical protein VG388_10635 [Solirubrobacteraceae bacterium]|nr:hypothetical protein [Solirubrobacteraceae bacterium]